MRKNIDLSKCRVCGEILGEHEVHTEILKLVYSNDKMGDLGGFVCTSCIIKESKINKLYHLSHCLNDIHEFVPRVPLDRAESENKYIPRVCLSSSIEGALSAVPWGGSNLEERIWEEGSYLIRVFEFDLDTLNLDNLLPPEYLYSKDLVRDSYLTEEYWAINKSIKPSRSYIIDIEDYELGWPDLIKCDDLVNHLNLEISGESPCYSDIIDGHITEIQEVKYEIIDEENRSKVYKLNNLVVFNTEDTDNAKEEIKQSIYNLYPNIRTWIDFDERLSGTYIVGEMDTRYVGEISKNKMLDFLNFEFYHAKIQEKSLAGRLIS